MYYLILLSICSIVQAVQVTITQGILKGTTESLVTADGTYLSFKGIPYGAPPIGALRFLAPTAAPSWTGVRNASAHGNICLQQDFANPGATLGSEDCLYLNVYTPTLKPNTTLPVMVFIHGGGFISGSGNIDNYGPDFLVQQDVIIVTFNYRLGPLGFLHLNNPTASGNAGLKDQVAALKWLQANIDKFGGDKTKVTIFGHSTGAASVGLHMLSPLSSGLFHRCIMMSGSPVNEFELQFQPERRAFAIGRLLGHFTNDRTDLLAFLQSVPAASLIGLKPNVLANEEQSRIILKKFYYTYVAERNSTPNYFIAKDTLSALKSGIVNDAALMIGHTDKEALSLYQADFAAQYATYRELFAPVRILDHTSPLVALQAGDTLKAAYFKDQPVSNATYENHIKYFNDASYKYDIYKFLSLSQSTLSRFLYEFSAVTSRNVYGNAGVSKLGVTAGAGHMDDVFYLFDPKQFSLPLSKNSTEYTLIQGYTRMFTNFAKHGNPTPRSITNDPFLKTTHWPRYNGTTKNYLEYGTTGISTSSGLDLAAITLFDGVYKTANIQY